jgi:hypothetical protein
MVNIYYLKDSKKFWETHKKARQLRDKKLAKLPFSEKTAISERIQADYEVLRNSNDESKQFGLGDIPHATNELSIELSFTPSDFEEAINELFPFTQELQANLESSKI